MPELYASPLPYPTELLEAVLVAASLLLASQWTWLRAALRCIPRDDVAWLVVWSVVALALRLAVGSRIPGHINGHGYEYLNRLLSGPIDGLEFHGNGIYALHQLGLAFLPWNETGVVAIQLTCSVLTVVAIYAVHRLWLGDRDGARASAAIAGVLPSFVFYGMSEERLVAGVFFVLVALVALGLAVRQGTYEMWAAAGALGAFAAAFQSFLLFFPGAAGILLLTQSNGRRAMRRGPFWFALAVYFVLGFETHYIFLSNVFMHRGPAAGMTSVFTGQSILSLLPHAGLRSDGAGNTFAHGDFTPPVFLWLALFGVAGSVRGATGRGTLAVTSIALVFTLLGNVAARMNTVRLQLPSHAFYVLLAGNGLGMVMAASRAAFMPRLTTAVAASIPVLAVVLWPGLIASRFTPELEHQIASEGLRRLPRGCTIGFPAIPQSPIPMYLTTYRTPSFTWKELQADMPVPDIARLVYFRPARCYDVQDGAADPQRTDGLRTDCAAIERPLKLTPLFVRSVAAQPDNVQSYVKDSLEIGYFSVGIGTTGSGQSSALEEAGEEFGTAAPIDPTLAKDFFDRATALREPDGCRFTDLDANRFLLSVKLEGPSGESQILDLVYDPERDGRGRRIGMWVMVAPPEVQPPCRATVAAIETVLKNLNSANRRPGNEYRRTSVGRALGLTAIAGWLFALMRAPSDSRDRGSS